VSPEEKARDIVRRANGMGQLCDLIEEALRDARKDALEEALRIVDSVNSHLTDEEQIEWIVGEIRSLKDKGGA
jgi:hypothetical protein